MEYIRNKVIRALQCCCKQTDGMSCKTCPYSINGQPHENGWGVRCYDNLMDDLKKSFSTVWNDIFAIEEGAI